MTGSPAARRHWILRSYGMFHAANACCENMLLPVWALNGHSLRFAAMAGLGNRAVRCGTPELTDCGTKCAFAAFRSNGSFNIRILSSVIATIRMFRREDLFYDSNTGH